MSPSHDLRRVTARTRSICQRAAGALLAGFMAFEGALRLTPFPSLLESVPPVSAEFVDRAGRPLRTLLVDDLRYSRRCGIGELSPLVLAATLSAEDRRFRAHGGVDLLATARALWSGGRSGASTISQQLVKLARPGARTFSRKLAEMWLALRVKRTWSKDRILAEYLHRLDYGNLQTGIASASRYYFDKPPSDLSAAESAFLAGLPKAPARLNPRTHFGEAQKRQRWVLHRMHTDGVLEEEALSRALAEPIALRPLTRVDAAPRLVDLLLQRRSLVRPGEIRTTLDLDLNRLAERALAENIRSLAASHVTSGAAVVLDNPTGEVLALAGFGDENNGAWMVRSPGSAMKPFTYLLALENGANPCTVVPDVPADFATPDGIYRPNNYNHRFHGPVSLRFALGNSLNVAAIRALELAGGPEALQRAMRKAGITTLDHPAEYYGLGLTLGNGEVRLLELANAFATLARLGVYRPYRLVLQGTPGGAPAQTLTGGAPVLVSRRVFDSTACFLLADMLADNAARAASFGLASHLAFDFPVACKTGTSSDYRDNWTVAYTPEFTVAVWVGNSDGTPMQGITGVTGAAPVMHEIFEHLRARFGTSWFERPAQIALHEVDPLTGRLAPPGARGTVLEKCLRAPEPARAGDYDDAGRVRLPAAYAEWLAGAQNHLGDLVAGAEAGPEMRILQPAPGSIYYLDGDLAPESQCIPLRAEARGKIEWSCPTLPLKTSGSELRAEIREGRHTILAREMATGREVATWIKVQRW